MSSVLDRLSSSQLLLLLDLLEDSLQPLSSTWAELADIKDGAGEYMEPKSRKSH